MAEDFVTSKISFISDGDIRKHFSSEKRELTVCQKRIEELETNNKELRRKNLELTHAVETLTGKNLAYETRNNNLKQFIHVYLLEKESKENKMRADNAKLREIIKTFQMK